MSQQAIDMQDNAIKSLIRQRDINAREVDRLRQDNTKLVNQLFAHEKEIVELRAAAPALLAAAQDAHALLFHYRLEREENGVDWGPMEALRQNTIDRLWDAITDAVPALRREAGGEERG